MPSTRFSGDRPECARSNRPVRTPVGVNRWRFFARALAVTLVAQGAVLALCSSSPASAATTIRITGQIFEDRNGNGQFDARGGEGPPGDLNNYQVFVSPPGNLGVRTAGTINAVGQYQVDWPVDITIPRVIVWIQRRGVSVGAPTTIASPIGAPATNNPLSNDAKSSNNGTGASGVELYTGTLSGLTSPGKVNFGFAPYARTVQGIVFDDANGDGAWNQPESLGGTPSDYTVTLIDANSGGPNNGRSVTANLSTTGLYSATWPIGWPTPDKFRVIVARNGAHTLTGIKDPTGAPAQNVNTLSNDASSLFGWDDTMYAWADLEPALGSTNGAVNFGWLR